MSSGVVRKKDINADVHRGKLIWGIYEQGSGSNIEGELVEMKPVSSGLPLPLLGSHVRCQVRKALGWHSRNAKPVCMPRFPAFLPSPLLLGLLAANHVSLPGGCCAMWSSGPRGAKGNPFLGGGHRCAGGAGSSAILGQFGGVLILSDLEAYFGTGDEPVRGTIPSHAPFLGYRL